MASLTGWSIIPPEVVQNGDGRPDLVAGNLGLNATYKTSEEKTFGVLANDFNNNMKTDIIFTVEENGIQYPFFGKAKLGRELTFINNKIPTFQLFSRAPINQIFEAEAIEKAVSYQVDTFASMSLLSNEAGSFTVDELPVSAQLSVIVGFVKYDVNQDGLPDLIIAGNMHLTEPESPRLDAGTGLWMKGDGNGKFRPVPAFRSGFWAPGDVKDLKLIDTPTGKAVLVANNSDSLRFFLIN